MPTGYTAPIADGMDFKNFVMRCARGMGALVMMRDDPLDAPIPERFEPSDFYVKKLEELHNELSWLESLTDQQADREASKAYDDEKTKRHIIMAERKALKEKYEAMLNQVRRWDPPTEDHQEFKKFMIDQLQESIDFDCDTTYYEEKRQILLPGALWRQSAISKIKEDIECYTAAHKREVERTASRNNWLKALRDSLEDYDA